jgi:hypothetical protein
MVPQDPKDQKWISIATITKVNTDIQLFTIAVDLTFVNVFRHYSTYYDLVNKETSLSDWNVCPTSHLLVKDVQNIRFAQRFGRDHIRNILNVRFDSNRCLSNILEHYLKPYIGNLGSC